MHQILAELCPFEKFHKLLHCIIFLQITEVLAILARYVFFPLLLDLHGNVAIIKSL